MNIGATANAPETGPDTQAGEVEQTTTSPARKQVKYPGLFDADGNPVLLKEFPEDYDPSQHKPFIRKDFVDESIWLNWKADMMEEKAKKYRDEANLISQFGSAEARKNAEKLLKARQKFEDLKKQLEGSDIDVDAILSSISEGASEGA